MEPLNDDIFQLFIEKLGGQLSASEEAHIEKKLATDLAFKAAWEKLEQDALAMKAGTFAANIDTGEALAKVRAQLQPAPKKTFTLKRALPAAAVLLLLASGAYFLLKPAPKNAGTLAGIRVTKQPVELKLANGQTITLNDSAAIPLNNATLNTGNNTLAYTSEDTTVNTLQVPAGENYHLVLSDGTEVWLNAASTLSFPFHFGKGNRQVTVSGEAFFKVAQNASQPFIVRTPLTEVQVLGTSFNINTYESGTVNTALINGSVITKNAGGQQLKLTPGMQAGFTAAKGFSSTAFDEDEVLSWMKGIYYYHRMSLPELADVAGRFYGASFHVDKAKFSHITVTGLMERDKLKEFLADLKTTASISYRFENNEIYLQ
ncbi:FecR family protein [uncultured Chitinophaga sp.]|uniref:FecR family protein n=1 Tax=uncultured Chitinophaga sp. TaxID=339340 RepID=UPI0025EA551B|nr:FecR family protein [uncultured Chitinophaga sp.]